MIFECNGIAGSGKTTLAKKLFLDLRKKDKKVIFIGVKTFRGAGRNKITKLMLKFSRLILILKPVNIPFFLTGRKYIKSATKEYLSKKSRYESYIALLYSVYIFDRYRKYKKETIVCDEGIIQSLTSLSISCNGDLKHIFSLLTMTMDIDVIKIFICCNIGIPYAMKRMDQRDRHDSAIDELSKAAIKMYLTDYQDREEIFRNAINQDWKVNVSMLEDNDSLSNKIIKFGGEFVD